MLNKIWLMCSFALFVTFLSCAKSEHGEVVSSCKYNGKDYSVFESNKKYGLIDEKDSLLIQARYNYLFDCNTHGSSKKGIIAVDSIKNCKALYTADGYQILPCEYDVIFSPYEFSEQAILHSFKKGYGEIFRLDGKEKKVLVDFGSNIAETRWIEGSEYEEMNDSLILFYKLYWRGNKISYVVEANENVPGATGIMDNRYDSIIEVRSDYLKKMKGPRVYLATPQAVIIKPNVNLALRYWVYPILKINKFKLDKVYREFIAEGNIFTTQIMFNCEISKAGRIQTCKHSIKKKYSKKQKLADELASRIIDELNSFVFPVEVTDANVEFPLRFSLERSNSLEHPIY